MGRMQLEVGGTRGVMELSCLDTSEGVRHIRPRALGPARPGCCPRVRCRGFPGHPSCPEQGSCPAILTLGHLPHYLLPLVPPSPPERA